MIDHPRNVIPRGPVLHEVGVIEHDHDRVRRALSDLVDESSNHLGRVGISVHQHVTRVACECFVGGSHGGDKGRDQAPRFVVVGVETEPTPSGFGRQFRQPLAHERRLPRARRPDDEGHTPARLHGETRMQVTAPHQHGRQYRRQELGRDKSRHNPTLLLGARCAPWKPTPSRVLTARLGDADVDEIETEIADPGEQTVELCLVRDPT